MQGAPVGTLSWVAAALALTLLLAGVAPEGPRPWRVIVESEALGAVPIRGAASAPPAGMLARWFEPLPEGTWVGRGDGPEVLLGGSQVLMRDPQADGRGVRLSFPIDGPAVLRPRGSPSGLSNYLLGDDPSKWRPGVPRHERIELGGEGSPWSVEFYFAPGGALEFDFVLQPHASPFLPRFSLAEGLTTELRPDGALEISSAGRDLWHLSPPRAYQVGSTQDDVRSRYVVEGGHVGFAVGPYDPARTLIIDPVATLAYSSYLGGSGYDNPLGVAVGPDGALYVAVGTTSADMPGLQGHRTQYQGPADQSFGNGDVYVAKISPDGSRIEWGTYLGGTGADRSAALTLDSEGNVVVGGATFSDDFPVVGGFQSTRRGKTSGFVATLDPSGSRLLYSTYLGGSRDDIVLGVRTDGEGHVYASGMSASPDFPLERAHQSENRGSYDAFVAKLKPDGSGLVYSTLLGSDGKDFAHGFDVTPAGEAFVVGEAWGADFPLLNPIDSRGSAYLAKLATNGTLLYSTHLGPGVHGLFAAVASDAQGNAFVAVQAYDAGHATAGAAREAFSGVEDALVLKVNSTGPRIDWATYLGGSGLDNAFSLAWDGRKHLVVSGSTNSVDFPVLDGSTGPEGENAFVAKLTLDGARWLYATVLGGSQADTYNQAGTNFLAVDTHGTAYLIGTTESNNFPRASPFQHEPGGKTDGYVAKVLLPTPPSAPRNFGTAPGESNGEVLLTWEPPETHGGVLVVNFRVYRGIDADSLSLHREVPAQTYFIDADVSEGSFWFYQVAAVSGAGMEGPRAPVSASGPRWEHDADPAGGGSTASSGPAVNRPPLARGSYVSNGLDVEFDAKFSFDPNGDTLTHRWDFGDGSNATGSSVRHAFAAPGRYLVTLTSTDPAGESGTSFLEVEVSSFRGPVPQIRFDRLSPLVGQPVRIDAFQTLGRDAPVQRYEWDLGTGSFREGENAITYSFPEAGTYVLRLRVTDLNNLTGVATRQLVVAAAPPVPPGASERDDPEKLRSLTGLQLGATLAALVWLGRRPGGT